MFKKNKKLICSVLLLASTLFSNNTVFFYSGMTGNPITTYINLIWQLHKENKAFPRVKPEFSKEMIQLLNSFLFYEQVMYESKLTYIPIDEKFDYKNIIFTEEVDEKNKELIGMIAGVMQQIKDDFVFTKEPSVEVMDSLIANYYFSVYTQKYIVLFFYKSFLNRENSDILNGLYNLMLANFPNNNNLIWMKLLLIISYYESLSKEAYDNNINSLSLCQDMAEEILEYLDAEYEKTLKIFKSSGEKKLKQRIIKDKIKKVKELIFYLTMIFFQKEIYKFDNLIANNDVGTGVNLFAKTLVAMRDEIYKRFLGDVDPKDILVWKNINPLMSSLDIQIGSSKKEKEKLKLIRLQKDLLNITRRVNRRILKMKNHIFYKKYKRYCVIFNKIRKDLKLAPFFTASLLSN